MPCDACCAPFPADTVAGMSVDIRAHIRDLSKRGFELPAIARAVSKIYKRDIQPHVEYSQPDGTTVQSPEWSLESIHRHLCMGGEFTDSVFQDSVRARPPRLAVCCAAKFTIPDNLCPTVLDCQKHL